MSARVQKYQPCKVKGALRWPPCHRHWWCRVNAPFATFAIPCKHPRAMACGVGRLGAPRHCRHNGATCSLSTGFFSHTRSSSRNPNVKGTTALRLNRPLKKDCLNGIERVVDLIASQQIRLQKGPMLLGTLEPPASFTWNPYLEPRNLPEPLLGTLTWNPYLEPRNLAEGLVWLRPQSFQLLGRNTTNPKPPTHPVIETAWKPFETTQRPTVSSSFSFTRAAWEKSINFGIACDADGDEAT